MNYYDTLLAMHEYALNVVPESYYNSVSAQGFGEQDFLIDGTKYNISLNSLFACEYFLVQSMQEKSEPASIAFAREICVENVTSPGYTKNKDTILKRLLSFNNLDSCMYLYNSHIVIGSLCIPVHELTKDVLFNYSISLSDDMFSTLQFLLHAHSTIKVDYICVRYRN